MQNTELFQHFFFQKISTEPLSRLQALCLAGPGGLAPPLKKLEAYVQYS